MTWFSAPAPPPVKPVPSISPSSSTHCTGPGTASRYPDAAMTTTNAVMPGLSSSL